jgi:hypothetical protein
MAQDNKTQKRYVFLLQKALVVCTQNRGSYTFHYLMDLRDFSVGDEWLRGRNVGVRLTR